MNDERTIADDGPGAATSPTADRPGPWGIGHRAWMVTALSLGGGLLVTVDGSLFTYTAPRIQQSLALSDAEVGAVYAAVQLVGAVVAFGAGPAMDRFGRKPVYQLCLLGTVVGSALTAGATSFLVLILARGITHGGAASEWTAGQVMIAEEAPARIRGRLMGLGQIGHPLGFLVGALLSMTVVPLLGWRVLFLFGLLPVVMMIFAQYHVDETERFTAASVAASLGRVGGAARYRQLLEPDLRRRTAFVAIWHLAYGFGFAGVLTSLPTVFRSVGASAQHVAAMAVTVTVVTTVGYLASAFLGDLIGRREAAAAFLVVGAGAGALLVSRGATVALLTLFLALVGFFTVGHLAAANGFAVEVFPTRVRGTGANIVAGTHWLGFVGAAAAGPVMVATLGRAETLLVWLVGCPTVAAACALGMRRVAPGTELDEIGR